jgi:hypothetical protein
VRHTRTAYEVTASRPGAVSSRAITRRTLLLATAAALAAPPVLRLVQLRGYDRDRRAVYEALVEALLDADALPGTAAGAPAAGDRLAALYAEALPRRRREIDAVLDGLAEAKLAHRSPAERIALLRQWAAAGGERRVLAARATTLAGAAYGPPDRPLPVVI